jgi:hypothetical protein
MKPTMSMYPSARSWQEAYLLWATDPPSRENEKSFILYEGEGPITEDNFLFQGTIAQFEDCFFSESTWTLILEWAKLNNHKTIMEGSVTYDKADEMLSDDDFNTDYYDDLGNTSPGGIYDAGGHIIGERFADFADFHHDRIKDDQ